ncbi:MAG TPA: hypothetical protein PLG79_13390 [Spirochaetales bacterium]|nr:hypothetical protein [Spirochaetales bacterium]
MKNNVMAIRVPNYAFTKELTELENSQYFKKYLRGRKKKEILRGFDEVMQKVKSREVEDWDRE